MTDECRKCELCKNKLTKNRKPLHHIQPKSKGGKGKSNNRADICKRCERILHIAEAKGFCILGDFRDQGGSNDIH